MSHNFIDHWYSITSGGDHKGQCFLFHGFHPTTAHKTARSNHSQPYQPALPWPFKQDSWRHHCEQGEAAISVLALVVLIDGRNSDMTGDFFAFLSCIGEKWPPVLLQAPGTGSLAGWSVGSHRKSDHGWSDLTRNMGPKGFSGNDGKTCSPVQAQEKCVQSWEEGFLVDRQLPPAVLAYLHFLRKLPSTRQDWSNWACLTRGDLKAFKVCTSKTFQDSNGQAGTYCKSIYYFHFRKTLNMGTIISHSVIFNFAYM